MKYHHQIDHHKRKKFVKRTFIVVSLIILAVIIAVVIIVVDLFRQQGVDQEATTKPVNTGFFAPGIDIFTTPYFQFQAKQEWAAVPDESGSDKFVYRSFNGKLVEHDLTIYINKAPSELSGTYVMPVKFKNNSREITTSLVSSHCKKAVGGDRLSEKQVTFSGVSFLCDVDNPQYIVLAGQKSGSPRLDMTRPDGSRQTYFIVYRNVTAKPESSQFVDILNTFQTR